MAINYSKYAQWKKGWVKMKNIRWLWVKKIQDKYKWKNIGNVLMKIMV